MPTPNTFIVYVTDAPAAARFYGDLFGMTPVFETPGFIAFDVAPGVQFALWRSKEPLARGGQARGEVCLSLRGGPEAIDAQFAEWRGKGVEVVSEPRDEVFGRTFVVADPDGNLIRVAPVD